jgi:multidrug resistance efflux pump
MRLMLVLLLIVVASVGYGAYWWLFLRGTVSTDDAYVDARIVSVASRLSERVDAVLVQEGDVVRVGQPLARFAQDKLEIGVAEARAQVQAAAAALDEVRNFPRPEEVEVTRAEVRVLEVELALQEQEWERAQQLARVRALSAQELERRRSAVASAHSQLEVGRRRLSLLLAGRATEAVARAEAALALARTQLQAALAEAGDAQLRSPIDGVVARQMVDPGEVVQKGQALFQIVESGKTWVVANLEEDEISAIRAGQPVRVWVDAYPGREFKGRVGPLYAATLSRFSLLPSSSASGSFIKVTQRVPVRIDWEEPALPPVYPGLNVVVRITVDDR